MNIPRPAKSLTLICLALTVAWLILAFVIPPPGMLGLIIGISWALLGYLHIGVGPIALILAFQEHRHKANIWIYLYFFLFAAVNLSVLGIYNRWDQLAANEWEKLTRSGDVELRRLAASQSPPDLNKAKQLLNAGADVDSVDPQFQTIPLLLATRNGHAELVSLLLEHGANVDIRDPSGDSALATALRGGAPLGQKWSERNIEQSIVSALIDAGANINAQNKKGESAILGACLNGDINIFEKMRLAGAKIEVYDAKGLSCMMLAERRGGIEFIRHLIVLKQDVNYKSPNGVSVLSNAFANDNSILVSLLLEAGADLSVLHTFERSLIRRAIERGHTASLEAVMNKGVGKAFKDAGFKDLEYFVRRGTADQLATLLKLGIDPDTQNQHGETALHFLSRCASCKDAAQMSQHLISAGADINLTGSNQSTPLKYAVGNGNVEVATVLIAAGADINELNKEGDSMLLYAALKGQAAMVDYLKANAARIIKSQSDGSYFLKGLNQPGSIKLLAGLGLNPDTPDQHGNWPILRAVILGKAESVQVLIAAGADPNTQNKSGRLALVEAVRHRRLASIQALIAGGADVNQKPRKDVLALYRAVDKRQVVIAITLLKAGAKVNSSIRHRAAATLKKEKVKGKNAGRLDELLALLAQAPKF